MGLVLLRSVLLAGLGPLMVFGMTAEAWVTSRYALGPHSATARRGFSITEIRWEDVRAVREEGDMLHLSPLTGEGKAQQFRGVRLILPPESDHRAKIIAFVQDHLPQLNLS